MIKLEEKLIELGYEYSSYDDMNCEKEYVKLMNGATLYFYTSDISNYHYSMCVANSKIIHNQNNIDNLQQAYNQLQQDLEVLKENEI